MEKEKRNHVQLDTRAYELIEQDKANVILSIETLRPTKAEVQFELKQKAEQTFKILKKLSKVDSSTHGQTITDNMVQKGNKWEKDGYKGVYSIGLVSYDFAKLNEAIELVQELAQVAQITTSISTTKKTEVEAKLTQQAISEFSARASLVSKSFGFGAYVLSEIEISEAQSEQDHSHSMRSVSNMSMLAVGSMENSSTESFYVQPRQERITVSISGTIVMSKSSILE